MSELTGEVRRISEELLGRIVGGSYPAGVRLPSEVELAKELSCGRSTVREALRHLAGLGVVRSRRGSGAMVLDFRREGTPALLPWYVMAGRFDQPVATLARELLRVRTLLAEEAVRMAAQHAPPGSLAEAKRLLDAGRALEGDPVSHAWNELAFFRAVVAASGIWPAVWLANAFWGPMRELHAQLAPVLGRVHPGFDATMRRLVAHVEAREVDAAVSLVRGWFEGVDRELLGLTEGLLGAASSKERRTSW